MHMRLLTIGGTCLLLMSLSSEIRAQDRNLQYDNLLTQAAATFCDGKALGRIDDQLYLSATRWLHCMVIGQRCEQRATVGGDLRSSILSCPAGPHIRDYEAERAEFWRRHDELQTECASAIGGPCGFSRRLLSDDDIAKIPGSNLSIPDPLP
jgi:hypothetical protein